MTSSNHHCMLRAGRVKVLGGMKLYEVLGAMLVGLLAIACDSTCEDANHKLDNECAEEIARAHEGQTHSSLPITGGSKECNDDERCVAVCILEADCPAIAWVMANGGLITDPNDTPPAGSGEFSSCIMECFDELSQE